MNARDRPIAKSQEKIHTYAQLRQQIHDDLRIQHPESRDSLKKAHFAMRFLTESALSLFIVGVVLYLYVLAAGAAVFNVFLPTLRKSPTI